MYLADTHALIWARENPARLSPDARGVMGDRSTALYFSLASIWEIAIKVSLGKLQLDGSIEEFVRALLHDGFEPLSIRVSHVAILSSLPLHHRDPFDRMLIAQAMKEELQVITADPQFANYPVRVFW